jgi:hypothetical protein
MKSLISAAALLSLLIAGHSYADPGRGADGNGGSNANREVNAAAKNDKDVIKGITDEESYYNAVDDLSHFGVGVADLQERGYSVNETLAGNKWDKNWDRLERAREDLEQ